MSGEGDDYDVGYGRPPTHTRFQKGQSGNPGGRPKGSLTMKEALMREGAREVQYTEDGKKTKATKTEITAKAMYQKAMTGDVAASRFVQAELASHPENTPTSGPGYDLTEADIAGMENHIKWLLVVEDAKRCASSGTPDNGEDHDHGKAT
jgi:hypothetical protein